MGSPLGPLQICKPLALTQPASPHVKKAEKEGKFKNVNPTLKTVVSKRKKQKEKRKENLRARRQDRESERRETERNSAATHAVSEAAKTRCESLLLLPTP